ASSERPGRRPVRVATGGEGAPRQGGGRGPGPGRADALRRAPVEARLPRVGVPRPARGVVRLRPAGTEEGRVRGAAETRPAELNRRQPDRPGGTLPLGRSRFFTSARRPAGNWWVEAPTPCRGESPRGRRPCLPNGLSTRSAHSPASPTPVRTANWSAGS